MSNKRAEVTVWLHCPRTQSRTEPLRTWPCGTDTTQKRSKLRRRMRPDRTSLGRTSKTTPQRQTQSALAQHLLYWATCFLAIWWDRSRNPHRGYCRYPNSQAIYIPKEYCRRDPVGSTSSLQSSHCQSRNLLRTLANTRSSATAAHTIRETSTCLDHSNNRGTPREDSLSILAGLPDN